MKQNNSTNNFLSLNNAKNKLSNILERKEKTYTNLGQIFSKRSRRRKKEVKKLENRVETASSNTNLKDVLNNTVKFFSETKKVKKQKNKVKKIQENFNKYLKKFYKYRATKGILCDELVKKFKDIKILSTGAFGSVKKIDYNGKEYIMKTLTQNNYKIKEEYETNKKLFDKCEELKKSGKLIDINYNFITKPICITNENNFIMEYGGKVLKDKNGKGELNRINFIYQEKIKIIEKIKLILLNLSLIELESSPFFLCSDLKLDNMVINSIGEVKLIDFGEFCINERLKKESNNKFRNQSCFITNGIIINDCLLNSNNCFNEKILEKLKNVNLKYEKKENLDLLLTFYAISYTIFIYQTLQFEHYNSINNLANKNETNFYRILFQNDILKKCFEEPENKIKIKKIFTKTDFGHLIMGLQRKSFSLSNQQIHQSLDLMFQLFIK